MPLVLPEGFAAFVQWLVDEHEFEKENILELLAKPHKWQKEFNHFTTHVCPQFPPHRSQSE